MKLCNVCGKELKRKHPGCNAKAERAQRELRAGIKELAATAAAQGIRVTSIAGPVHFGDPLALGIASMGQPARDAILRRMVTQREKR